MFKVSLLRTVIFILAFGSGALLAQTNWQRALPPDGKLGVLGDPAPLPLVQVDGRNLRLAPGGVIFDETNRTIVHAALRPNARVLYTTNKNGDVLRMYLLTPAEQQALERSGKR